VRDLLAAAAQLPPDASPFAELLRLRATRRWRRADANDEIGDEEHASLDALLGWAASFGELRTFLAAAAATASRLTALRRPDATVELVTVHGAKGREWQTVVVLGMEEDRMPNRRSLAEAADPARALEEERRLAYVAVTRATRRLVLAVNPDRPSPFLAEMGLLPRDRPRAPRR
jgi:superfamily I DNA/RNA helicase